MTPFEIWQLERYGNFLPDSEPEEQETALLTSETNYIYEQTATEAFGLTPQY
jgi:hypothetical protein